MGHIAFTPRKLIYYVVACCIAACLVLVFFSKSAIASQLNSWKVLPRPERFTELYFTHHTQLPRTFKVGGQQEVAFTTHNLEDRKTDYDYQILARTDTKQQLLAQGHFSLTPGQSQDIARHVTIPLLASRVAVEVKVEYFGIPFGHDAASKEKQAIHYWINQTK